MAFPSKIAAVTLAAAAAFAAPAQAQYSGDVIRSKNAPSTAMFFSRSAAPLENPSGWTTRTARVSGT